MPVSLLRILEMKPMFTTPKACRINRTANTPNPPLTKAKAALSGLEKTWETKPDGVGVGEAKRLLSGVAVGVASVPRTAGSGVGVATVEVPRVWPEEGVP